MVSDNWFAILLTLVLFCFAGVGVILLLWPSRFLRRFDNPLQPDTPVNRVHMRAVGVFVCLFVLVPISWSVTTFEGFHKNILLALWASPLLLPIFLWILSRYSPLQKLNRRYLAGEAEECDPAAIEKCKADVLAAWEKRS